MLGFVWELSIKSSNWIGEAQVKLFQYKETTQSSSSVEIERETAILRKSKYSN